MSYLRFLTVGLAFLVSASYAVDFDEYPQARELLDELVTQHAMDREWTEALIRDAVYQDSIIEAITRPAEKRLPWYRYRKIFVTDSGISRGADFWKRNHAIIERAEQHFGVDASIIVAIIGVETRYGKNTGRYRILDSLITLTLGYPRRSDFFKSELIAFLQLTAEENIDPLTAKGSYAGAMGIPQFISSSYRHYAVDFNNNGQRNLLTEVEDAIGSVANYLKLHGWLAQAEVYADLRANDNAALDSALTDRLNNDRSYAELKQAGIRIATEAEPPSDAKFGVIKYETRPGKFVYRAGFPNFYVITKYNRSTLYAMAVAELAEKIAAARQGY